MEIVQTVRDLQRIADRLRVEGRRIGLVPTMGYLHEGHASLIRLARRESDFVVTSIFVNPTQFGPNEDYMRYPRDLSRDRTIAGDAGTDALFTPDVKEMYPEGFETSIVIDRAAQILEGKIRPGHFRGVATIVAKLFHSAKPHLAIFGQKDAQQAYIIKRMTADLNFDVRILVAPIVREADGLAMSSRNTYLSPDQRKNATVLFRALQEAERLLQKGERSITHLRRAMEEILRRGSPDHVDYIAFVEPETFREVDRIDPPAILIALAVRFGSTRLIDNIVVSLS